MIQKPTQLSLGIALRDDATFDNFYAADDASAEAVAALKKTSRRQGEPSLVIWGARGSGVTHLLQACSHEASANEVTVQYLPLQELAGYAPEDICEGLEALELVCLDGLDEVCGNRQWERAVFHLFNNLRDAGHKLVIAAHTSPPSLPIVLPDLKSRLLGSPFYHLRSLTDPQKKDVLQKRARARGIDMSDEVATFILNRAPRDTAELFVILNQLDEESLQQQRKLTIPFVKTVLGI